MTLVLDRPLEVGRHLDPVRRLGRRRLDRRGIGRLAAQGHLDSLGADCLGPDSGHGDPGRAHLPPAVEGDDGGDPDHGEPRGWVRVLEIGGAGVRRKSRDPNLREYLVGSERCGEKVLEEVIDLDGPGALGSDRLQLGSEGEDDRRPVGSGIRVGQASSHRPQVANLGVTDHGGRVGEHRALRLEARVGFDRVVGRQGADDGGPAVLAHAGQAADPPDVDQVLGLGQAQLHHGDEAVAAGEQLRVVFVAGQEPNRLLDARHPMVLEGRRVHWEPPLLLRALNRRPDPGRRQGQVDVRDPERDQGVEDGVGDGRRGRDGARLPRALHTYRVDR